ncbi:MAG: TrmB family transcriptional regulator [Candidatus Heimdallarchaeota archaeon]|nr:TrmB family transcriptional regulator [Candidatus Heimdallarchaeota archaeon]
MSEKDDLLKPSINSLIALGWSEYESKTYSALVGQGRSTAYTIAKKSDVPQNRVYQILNKLKEKGHVQAISAFGGPTRYTAVNPQQVLDLASREYNGLIGNAKDALKVLQERESDVDLPKTFTIAGKREVNVQLFNMIEKTENELLIAVDTLIEIQQERFVQLFNNMDTNKVKILTTTRGVNDDYERKVLADLDETKVKVSEDSFCTILAIADNQRLMFISLSIPISQDEKKDDDLENKDYFGFYMEHEETTEMFRRLFESSWENAIPAEEYVKSQD